MIRRESPPSHGMFAIYPNKRNPERQTAPFGATTYPCNRRLSLSRLLVIFLPHKPNHAVNRLRAKVSRRRPRHHDRHIRVGDIRPAGYANLQRRRPILLKRPRTSIACNKLRRPITENLGVVAG